MLRGVSHVAKNKGKWSSPSIWSSGSVPSSGSFVHIPSGISVQYDVNSDAVCFISFHSLKWFIYSLFTGNYKCICGGNIELVETNKD